MALNCSLNGRIVDSNFFDEVFIQPASGDDGAAFGACLLSHKKLTGTLTPKKWHNFYLGSSYTEAEIEDVLKNYQINYSSPPDIFQKTALALKDKKIIGWFQNKMEFGARALGNRSILADPRDIAMKDILNEKIKKRESFRPFAPVILDYEKKNWFMFENANPYMSFVETIIPEKRSMIAAVSHVDGTGRLQSVSKHVNPLYYDLINKFYEKTGVPVIINTSMNVMGEPIVNTPEQAHTMILKTDMDYLVMGNFILSK